MQILNANFKCKIKIFMAKSKYLWQNQNIYGKIKIFMAK